MSCSEFTLDIAQIVGGLFFLFFMNHVIKKKDKDQKRIMVDMYSLLLYRSLLFLGISITFFLALEVM